MKLMLGWTWADALAYAEQNHWRINHVGRRFFDRTGDCIMFCCGDSRKEARAICTGQEYSEIIRGSKAILPDVEIAAKAAVRRATEAPF